MSLFDTRNGIGLFTRKPVPLREHRRVSVNGTETGVILIERATVGDLPQVNAMHRRCSPASRRARYHQSRESLKPSEWRTLCGHGTGWTWLARPAADDGRILGMVSVLPYSNRSSWDLSILIDDAWQGRRLGTIMARHAVASTQAAGVDSLEALVERDNVRSLKLLRRLGAAIRFSDAFTAEAHIRLRRSTVTFAPAWALNDEMRGW
ncbi:GNAT family N-acetyltransferase [Actinacidiphila glaucinigra]|uniref:GNAT family N-acetyltransferase n=1 Tax=Actinacidiphila glaucinigra TaxID=235986 RepID=UPI002DDBA38D|nr:GNAT family N-acetyltransferase [Actinacidiphila glaucinigra]WSD64775.1 GNAT family N-acetyltransferase [Actinacidiphila glaucinigra]